MNAEMLRMVEEIHQERSIDKEVIFQAIEQAIVISVKKHFKIDAEINVKIDRQTGDITAYEGGKKIDPVTLGRITAQSAKQIILQKIKEAERDKVFGELGTKKGDIITGRVSHFEGPHMVCQIGKAEAILLKGEQVAGESFRPGTQIRAYVLDIEKKSNYVKVYLSRANENFVRRLFELEVPEIADGTISFKGMVREPGYRTKIMVQSKNEKIDPVGACVGVKGSRIRSIVDELNGENIDIVKWSDNPTELVKNALKPAEISDIKVDARKKQATVYVTKDELSQAIGKGGRNVRLASKLTDYEIDIYELREKEENATPKQSENKGSETGIAKI